MSSRENHSHQSRSGQKHRTSYKFNKFQGTHFNDRSWKNNNRAHWNQRNWSKRSRGSSPYKRPDLESESSYRPSHYYKTFPNNYYGANPNDYNQGESRKEPEEEGPPLPGSEAERSNKIELDKKRIREALSSAADINPIINFKNSANEDCVKENLQSTKNTPLLELRLTANDLMEIGSVTGRNNDAEDNNLVPDERSSYTSQRCNINTSKNNSQQNYNKSQSGGWKAFQIPTEVNVPDGECSQMSSVLPNSQPCNDRDERILGSVVSSPRFVEEQSVNINDSNRIGRLYKSFLKARYFQSKSRLSKNEESSKQRVQNPLLDTSIANSQNIPNESQNDRKRVRKTVSGEEEPEMPLPIKIKMEIESNTQEEKTMQSIEEHEADEFLKEFSHLLNPDLRIPSETLESLGLSHLISPPTITQSTGTVPSKKDGLLRVKSLTTLNSTPFVDSGLNNSLRNTSLSPVSMASLPSASPKRFTDSITGSSELNVRGNADTSLNRSRTDSQSSVNESSVHQGNKSVPLADLEDIITRLKQTVNSTIGNQSADKQNSIGKTSENLQIQADFSINNRPSTSAQTSFESHISRKVDKITECSNNCQSKSQLIDVSDKMVKLFVIDKQIQELMEEKIKLYNELMSTKEIASTFFNSWAKDKHKVGMMHRTSASDICTLSNVSQQQRNEPRSKNTENDTPHENVQDSFIRPSTSNVEPTTLNNLLNDVDAVKQYLLSFQTNTISDAVNACKESLLEIKKEGITRYENEEVIDTSINVGHKSNSVKEKVSKKRKKKSVIENNAPEKKKCNENNSDENFIENNNSNMFDEVIEIDSSEENEKFEDLYETKFEPSNFKGHSSNEPKQKKVKVQKDVTLQFNHKEATILCMKISELQKVCITGCRDGKLLIYSLTSGRLKGKLEGHQESITCICEYKGLVISGSTDSTLRCYHIKTKTELYCVKIGYAVQCMDLKYGFLFVGTKVGFLYTYSVKESLNMIDDPLNLTNSSILAVKAAKEGVRKIVIVAARGEQITVRDATTGLLIRTFNWCDTVFCLECVEEAPIVYCGTRTKSVVGVDFINGEEKIKCDAGPGVSQIFFSHGLMFTACYDGKVYVYDYKKKSLVTRITVSKGMLLSLVVYQNQVIVATTRNELLAIPFPEELRKYLNFEEKTS